MNTHVEPTGGWQSEAARPATASITLRRAVRARGHAIRVRRRRGGDPIGPRLPLLDESPPPDWAAEDRALGDGAL